MNKREKLHVFELEQKLERALAESAMLRAMANPPDKVLPDIPRPTEGETTGYTFKKSSRRVEPAWSQSHRHKHGQKKSVKGIIAIQGSIELFSTRKMALQGLWNAMFHEYSEALGKIYKEIERCSLEKKEDNHGN
jgi:hypothetical protein